MTGLISKISKYASSPQGKSVTIGPIQTLESAIPTSEREVVLLPQRGREHREPDQDRGEARLRRSARGQDDPAVPLGYSPNGLKGFGLVEVMTLFVSR